MLVITMEADKKKAPEFSRGLQRKYDHSKVNDLIYHKDRENQAFFEEKRKERYWEKFQETLRELPQRGGGLHGALLTVCNHGVRAGLSGDELYNEIAATGRAFKHNEIYDAIKKAETGQRQHTVFKQKPTFNSGTAYSAILNKDKERAARLRNTLIEKGGNIDPFGADVWECSNPRPAAFFHVGGLDGSECCFDMLLFLQELYCPDDLLYIGSGYEKANQQQGQIKTAAQWLEYFTLELENIRQMQSEQEQYCGLLTLSRRFEYFVINPLSGQPQQSGSYRSDANVTAFRYVLLESDTLSLEKQLSLLNGLHLPVVALTYTGGKSIHALLDASVINGNVQLKEYSKWQEIIKENLFGQLAPLGFDRQTSNPARLSRLPGIWRHEKNQFQKLLYINKKGTPLCLKH